MTDIENPALSALLAIAFFVVPCSLSKFIVSANFDTDYLINLIELLERTRFSVTEHLYCDEGRFVPTGWALTLTKADGPGIEFDICLEVWRCFFQFFPVMSVRQTSQNRISAMMLMAECTSKLCDKIDSRGLGLDVLNSTRVCQYGTRTLCVASNGSMIVKTHCVLWISQSNNVTLWINRLFIYSRRSPFEDCFHLMKDASHSRDPRSMMTRAKYLNIPLSIRLIAQIFLRRSILQYIHTPFCTFPRRGARNH